MLCAIHSSIHQSWSVSRAPRPDCTVQHSHKDTTLPPLPFLFSSHCVATAASWQGSRGPSDFWHPSPSRSPASRPHLSTASFFFSFLAAKQLRSIWLLNSTRQSQSHAACDLRSHIWLRNGGGGWSGLKCWVQSSMAAPTGWSEKLTDTILFSPLKFLISFRQTSADFGGYLLTRQQKMYIYILSTIMCNEEVHQQNTSALAYHPVFIFWPRCLSTHSHCEGYC